MDVYFLDAQCVVWFRINDCLAIKCGELLRTSVAVAVQCHVVRFLLSRWSCHAASRVPRGLPMTHRKTGCARGLTEIGHVTRKRLRQRIRLANFCKSTGNLPVQVSSYIGRRLFAEESFLRNLSKEKSNEVGIMNNCTRAEGTVKTHL